MDCNNKPSKVTIGIGEKYYITRRQSHPTLHLLGFHDLSRLASQNTSKQHFFPAPPSPISLHDNKQTTPHPSSPISTPQTLCLPLPPT